MNEKSVLLIGGTSHTGKSFLAQAVRARTGWTYISTDMLARHPGRPWPSGSNSVPAHVVEHYSTLSTEERMHSVIAHYRSLWPTIEDRIETHLEGSLTQEGCVIEGSAILPENFAGYSADKVAVIWLTASDSLLENRIRQESRYSSASEEGRVLIDNFIRRALAFNRWVMADVQKHQLQSVAVDERTTIDDLVSAVGEDISFP
ncbi:MAG: hypothetical protein ABJN26_21980 [Stappiaceae bacterium]